MIVGVNGIKRSGKNTIANRYVLRGYEELSFAKALKDFCQEKYDFSHDQMYGDEKDMIDLRYNKTPREILQEVGDEYREIDENYFSKIIEEYMLSNPNKNYVISDCRFMNEYDMIKRHNGFIIRVERPNYEHRNRESLKHKSETQEIPYDHKIKNIYESLDEFNKVIDVNIDFIDFKLSC